MDPVSLSIAIAANVGLALYAALEKLAEKGIVDPALEKGLEPLRQWLTSKYEQKKEELKLRAMLGAAFEATIKTQRLNEAARDLWLSKLERLKTDPAIAQETCAAALGLMHETDPLPPELTLALHLDEAQQAAFRRFLLALRQQLAAHPAYSAALTYLEELEKRRLLEGMYEQLAALTETVGTAQGQKVVRVQVLPEDAREKEKKYLDNALLEFGGLPLEGRAKDDTLRPDDQLRLEQVYIALNTTAQRHWPVSAEKAPRKIGREGENALEARPLSALRAVMEARRAVLLGDPGSGKSTLVQHLCLCLAGARRDPHSDWPKHLCAADVERWELGAYPFPLFVRLRLFAEDRDALPMDPKQMGRAEHLLAYLLKEIDKLGRAMDDHACDLLESGQALVVCDGLDEVTHPDPDGKDAARLDAARRAQVAQAILHFSQRYPYTRLIVTCRVKQYPLDAQGAPAADWGLRGWPVYTLTDFDDTQVERFVKHWFAELQARGRQSAADAEEKCGALLHALGARHELRDLAPKPILLTQMALVHAHRKLPDSRIDVYKECAELLLWEWQRLRARQSGKQGEAAQDFLERLLPGLRLNEVEDALDAAVYAAHAAGEAEISAERVRLALTALLEKQYRLSEDEAMGKAQRFIALWLRARNGLLIPAGEQSFTVPHRSFREFMAARYLDENVLPDPETGEEEEWECSAPRLARADPDKWREVFRFVAGLNSASKVASALEALYPDETLAYTPEALSGLLLSGDVMRDVDGPAFCAKSKRGKEFYQRVERHLIHVLRNTDPAQAYPHDAPRWPPPSLWLSETRLLAGELLDDLNLWAPDDLDVFVPIPPAPGRRRTPQSAITPPQSLWVAKYPVTNLQYARFLAAPDYADETLWRGAQGFDAKGRPLKDVGEEAWNWFKENGGQHHRPDYWDEARFGAARRLAPVVTVTWYEAAAYCAWLTRHWREIPTVGATGPAVGATDRSPLPDDVGFRLPLEAEWAAAAGGEEGDRYPWQTRPEAVSAEAIKIYANTSEAGLQRTSPVCMYPSGMSTLGVMDMAGNVWEWQANMQDETWQSLRGGSWYSGRSSARVAFRFADPRANWVDHYGFRVVGVVPISLK